MQKGTEIVEEMWTEGYCGLDIVGTLFRVTKFEEMSEPLKLDFIKVCPLYVHQGWPSMLVDARLRSTSMLSQEVGFTHMRVLDGLDTLLQMSGLVAKLCCVSYAARGGKPAPPRQE